MNTQYDSYTVEEHNAHAVVERIARRKEDCPNEYLYWINDEGEMGSSCLANLIVMYFDKDLVKIRFNDGMIFPIDVESLFWTRELAIGHLESGKRERP